MVLLLATIAVCGCSGMPTPVGPPGRHLHYFPKEGVGILLQLTFSTTERCQRFNLDPKLYGSGEEGAVCTDTDASAQLPVQGFVSVPQADIELRIDTMTMDLCEFVYQPLNYWNDLHPEKDARLSRPCQVR